MEEMVIQIPRTCTACASDHLEEIESALRSGDRPGVLAQRFPELSEGSIRRHSAHMQTNEGAIVLTANEIELAERLQPDRLAGEYGRLFASAEAVSRHALENAAPVTALKAISTQAALLDSVRKLRDSAEDAKLAADSADSANELRILVGALRLVLPLHKLAGLALAEALEEAGEWNAASGIRNLVR